MKAVDKEKDVNLSRYQPDLDAYAVKQLAKGHVWIAQTEHETVGMVTAYANDMSSRCAYLLNVNVRSMYRRHGIARQLLTHCLEYLHTTPMEEVHLESNNPIAIKLYSSLGFEIYQQEEKYNLPYVWMKRKV